MIVKDGRTVVGKNAANGLQAGYARAQVYLEDLGEQFLGIFTGHFSRHMRVFV